MTEREVTVSDYMAMFRRHWVLIVVLTVIGGPLAYAVSRFLPNRYKSQTLVLVQQPGVSADLVKPVNTISVNEELASMQQQILSRSRLEPVIRQYGLYPKDIDRVSMEDLVARLQKTVEVTAVQPMAETSASNLPGFYVNVTLDDAQKAQQVCTALTSMFIEENLKRHIGLGQEAVGFFEQELNTAKQNLDQQDAKLADFKKRYIGALPDEEQTNLNLLAGLNTQLDAATQALSRAQQDKAFAQSMLTQQITNFQAFQGQGAGSPDALEQRLTTLQTQLATLQARYTDDYPDVIKTKNDIASVQREMSTHGDTKAPTDTSTKLAGEPLQITQLRAQIHAYDQEIASKAKDEEAIRKQIQLYQGRVQATPAVEQQYKELTRGYQTALDSYNELLKKRDDTSMANHLDEKQQGEQFTVLDPANLPDKPSFPNRPLFALGGLGGGLALGLGLTVFLEMANQVLRTERDVEFALRLPVLAIVPAVGNDTAARKTESSNHSVISSGLHADARA